MCYRHRYNCTSCGNQEPILLSALGSECKTAKATGNLCTDKAQWNNHDYLCPACNPSKTPSQREYPTTRGPQPSAEMWASPVEWYYYDPQDSSKRIREPDPRYESVMTFIRHASEKGVDWKVAGRRYDEVWKEKYPDVTPPGDGACQKDGGGLRDITEEE